MTRSLAITALGWGLSLAGVACGSAPASTTSARSPASAADRAAPEPSAAPAPPPPPVPVRRGSPELLHAVETLERAAALMPTPPVLLALGLAYERVDDLVAARRTSDALHREKELREPVRERLERLDAILAARTAGAPRGEDPSLDEQLVQAAQKLDRRGSEELHQRYELHEQPRDGPFLPRDR